MIFQDDWNMYQLQIMLKFFDNNQVINNVGPSFYKINTHHVIITNISHQYGN